MFTKLHDRRIANVGVGVRVGDVECQLYATLKIPLIMMMMMMKSIE